MYVKSRESATTVVNMGTRVYIVWREKRTITLRTSKSMDTPLNNVIARKSTGNNERTVTRKI